MSLKPYSKEWLEELCKESFSYREVTIKAGRKPGGGSQNVVKTKIEEYGIDISHFTGKVWNKGKTKDNDERVLKYSISKRILKDEDIFVKNSDTKRSVIRNRIITDKLIDYKCEFCGNDGHWLNKELPLELDHINGVNNDHRLENLRWLCPNCHSLTETYRGRNKRNRQTHRT